MSMMATTIPPHLPAREDLTLLASKAVFSLSNVYSSGVADDSKGKWGIFRKIPLMLRVPILRCLLVLLLVV
jgi:hypothetical protein